MQAILTPLWFLVVTSRARALAATCTSSNGKCPPHYYKDMATELCVPCPVGAVCAGNTSVPVPHQGYWGDLATIKAAAFTGSEIQMHKCFRGDCKGGVDENDIVLSPECWQQGASTSTCSTDALICSAGSRGPLCQSCTRGYNYQPGSKVCKSCKATKSNSGFEIGLYCAAIACLIIGVLVVAVSFELLIMPLFVYDSWIFGVFSNVSLAAVKIVVGFFTVLTGMVAVASAQFPSPFRQFVDLLQQDVVDGFTTKCSILDALGGNGSDVLESVRFKAYAWFFSPVVLVIFIVALGYIRCRFVGSSNLLFANPDEKKNDSRLEIHGQHSCAVGLLVYIFVPMTAMRLFSALDCISVGHESLLRIDMLVSCESEKYQSFKNELYALLIATLLVPLWFLFRLFLVRTKLNPPLLDGDDGSLLMYVRARDQTIQGFRVFFQDYKPKWWYYDVYDIYRRVVFAGVLQVFKTDMREATGVLFGLFAVLAASEIKPYASWEKNALSTVAQVMIVLVYAGAYALENGTLESINDWVIGWIFIVLSTAVVALAVYLAYRAHKGALLASLLKLERTQRKIENACEFSVAKLVTTIEAVARNSVPSAHILVYHYCSFATAGNILTSGFPAKLIACRNTAPGNEAPREGVLFTTHLPHELRELEKSEPYFDGERDVMLAISINARFLVPATDQDESTPKNIAIANEDAPYLWLLPSVILSAMRSGYFGDVLDPQPWLDNKTMLPPHCIVRAYQLINDANIKRERNESTSELPHLVEPTRLARSATLLSNPNENFARDNPVSSTAKKKTVQRLATIVDFHQEMTLIRGLCIVLDLVPVYHFTSLAGAEFIIKDGFRMSTQGQGDGGVYFSVLGPTCYDIGSVDYEDSLIIDLFGVERLDELRGAQRLDVCIVYAADPAILTPAPGGRKNVVVVSKGTFTDLSLPFGDGSFFLRPDRTMGAFLINPWDPPCGRREGPSDAAVEVEKAKDFELKNKLAEMEINMTINSRLASSLYTERHRLKESANSVIGDPSVNTVSPMRRLSGILSLTKSEHFKRPSLEPSTDRQTSTLKASISQQRQRSSKRVSVSLRKKEGAESLRLERPRSHNKPISGDYSLGLVSRFKMASRPSSFPHESRVSSSPIIDSNRLTTERSDVCVDDIEMASIFTPSLESVSSLNLLVQTQVGTGL